MGDVLADYAHNGGGVVLLQFCFGAGWNLDGRILAEYSPLYIAGTMYTPTNLGEYDAGHPIMEGVTGVSDIYEAGSSVINNGELVASWDIGVPFVAANPDQPVVAINGYIGDYRQFTGDMMIIVHNALNYVGGGTQVIPEFYRVYKSNSVGGPFNQLIQLAGTITQHLDTPVPNGVDYWYRVTAVYPGNQESDPSNVAQRVPPPDQLVAGRLRLAE